MKDPKCPYCNKEIPWIAERLCETPEAFMEEHHPASDKSVCPHCDEEIMVSCDFAEVFTITKIKDEKLVTCGLGIFNERWVICKVVECPYEEFISSLVRKHASKGYQIRQMKADHSGIIWVDVDINECGMEMWCFALDVEETKEHQSRMRKIENTFKNN